MVWLPRCLKHSLLAIKRMLQLRAALTLAATLSSHPKNRKSFSEGSSAEPYKLAHISAQSPRLSTY
eukprot:4138883-Pleurochrysis_carterae.AAC.2